MYILSASHILYYLTEDSAYTVSRDGSLTPSDLPRYYVLFDISRIDASTYYYSSYSAGMTTIVQISIGDGKSWSINANIVQGHYRRHDGLNFIGYDNEENRVLNLQSFGGEKQRYVFEGRYNVAHIWHNRALLIIRNDKNLILELAVYCMTARSIVWKYAPRAQFVDCRALIVSDAIISLHTATPGIPWAFINMRDGTEYEIYEDFCPHTLASLGLPRPVARARRQPFGLPSITSLGPAVGPHSHIRPVKW